MSYLEEASERYGGAQQGASTLQGAKNPYPRSLSKRIALRAVLDCLDKGVTVHEIIDACATIEPESK